MTLCPSGDAHMTLAGKVKEWDMLKDCGVVDGSTVFVSYAAEQSTRARGKTKEERNFGAA